MRTILALILICAAAPVVRAQQRAFHVVDYDLTVDLPETGRTIHGLAKLTIVRKERADTLALDLQDLKVTHVSSGGAPVGWRQDSAHVYIPVAAERRDTLHITVEYEGAVTDGLVIRTDSAGRWMAFGDNWPNRGRRWIPSIDHPSDKSTVSWTVRAPSDRTVIANGALVGQTTLPVASDPDGSAGHPIARTETRWRESRPIPVYLMVIAAAPLFRYDLGATACGFADGGGCVNQAVYVAPEQRGMLPGPFARAGDIVKYFAGLVGPFPYEKLAHLQSSTRFGGMENASNIFYADAPFRRGNVSLSVVAHETAHQWFGDAVTEREWSHAWLSEGFATYFAALYMRHAFGDSAFKSEMARTRAQLLTSPVVASRPVIDTLQTDLMAMLNANSYEKGGWTLHMLRTVVGDSAFFRGVRSYWRGHKNGTALTDDLMSAVERESGMKLGWFFDQWLRRPGYASVATTWRYDAASRRVVVDVRQGGRFAPYRFPLAIDVVDATGAVHRVRVEVRAQASARLTLPLELSAPPRSLAFDPDVELLAEFVQ